MQWIQPVLIVVAVVTFIIYVLPKITVIPPVVRMVLTAVAFLVLAIYLINAIVPRFVG